MPDSILTALNSLPDTAKVTRLIKEANNSLYSQPALSRSYCDKAMHIAESLGSNAILAKVVNQRGTVSWAEGKYTDALSDYKLAKTYFEYDNDSLGIAKSNNNLGLVYSDISAYDLALEYFLPALAFLEQQNDIPRLATIYNNVGNVYARNNDVENATDYYVRSLKSSTSLKDTASMAMVQNNLGLVYRNNLQLDIALSYFQQSLDGFILKNHLLGQASVLDNIGSIKRDQGEFETAEELHLRSLEIAKTLNNDNTLQISHLKLSELFIKSGSPEKAIFHARKSLEAGTNTTALLEKATAHQALAEAFQQTKVLDSALSHFKTYKQLNDSIFNKSKDRSITEMRVRFETDLKDAEIEALQKQKKFDQLTTWGLVAFLITILVIGILVFLRQKAVVQKSRLQLEMSRQANESQKAIAAAQLETAASERSKLQLALDYKTKEISQLAMNIAKRHDFLASMDAELKELKKEMSMPKLKALSTTVSQTLNLENERKDFMIYIQEAQSNFFMKLDEAFPKLSDKDKRLCAMVKMGLSNKEIAAVFNIETSSVEVARYRLRKKLDLSSNDNLKAFLDKFQ